MARDVFGIGYGRYIKIRDGKEEKVVEGRGRNGLAIDDAIHDQLIRVIHVRTSRVVFLFLGMPNHKLGPITILLSFSWTCSRTQDDMIIVSQLS